jgi:hypothetical protein
VSVESLLFLALFFLLPLIERFNEHRKKQRQQTQAPVPTRGDRDRSGVPDPLAPPRSRRHGKRETRPEQPAPQPRRVPPPPPMPMPLPEYASPKKRRPAVTLASDGGARTATSPVVYKSIDATQAEKPVAGSRRTTRAAVARILGNSRSMRRALVVTTALNPCRAIEPFDR